MSICIAQFSYKKKTNLLYVTLQWATNTMNRLQWRQLLLLFLLLLLYTRPTSVYTFLPFYLIVLIRTELWQYIVLSFGLDCIGWLYRFWSFYYFIFSYSAIFAASMSINVQYSVFSIQYNSVSVNITDRPNPCLVDQSISHLIRSYCER